MKDNIKLAAIVIWFNPETIGVKKIIENIKSYSTYIDKVYIVDNSPIKHRELSTNIENSFYIFNNNKGGIAGAQNLGWKKAQEDGFEWIMTMDQDSFFEPGQFVAYRSKVIEYISCNEKGVCFGPRINDLNEKKYLTKQIRYHILSPIKRLLFKLINKNWKPAELPDVEINRNLIASANIVKISILTLVNGYDEKLFIDQVDFDLCNKIKCIGYETVRFNTVYLNQIYGDKNFFAFIKPKAFYSQFRFYYIIRNHVILAARYQALSKIFNKELKELYFQYCVFSLKAFSNKKIFEKAKKDALTFLEEEK